MTRSISTREILIGIVVPAYNSARHLPTLLSLIANSARQQFECVVVNDGVTIMKSLTMKLDVIPALGWYQSNMAA